MNQADRYEIIRPLFLHNDIKAFLELFDHVPASVFAGSLGKKSKRFLELLQEIDQFTIEEISQIARLCKLTMSEIFTLMKPDLKRLYKNREFNTVNNRVIKAMYKAEMVVTFSDIFKYFYLTEVAAGSSIDRRSLRRSKEVIKKARLSMLLRVGLYNHLTIAETLILIENEYYKQISY